MNDVRVPERGRRTWFVVLGMACLVVVTGTLAVARWGSGGGFIAHVAFQGWGTDDAYITFRYAANVMSGLGPVFNAGERVEGYSSPGFLLLMLPWLRMGTVWAYPGAVAMSGVAAMACPWLTWRIGRCLGLTAAAAACVAVACAASPLVWLWAASGMETLPMMALQLALVWWVVREGNHKRLGLIVLGAGCVFMRADGFVLPTLLVGWLLTDGKDGRRSALPLLAGVLLTLAGMTIWRLVYYGAPLPNTVTAKVAGDWLTRGHWASLGVLSFMLAGGAGIGVGLLRSAIDVSGAIGHWQAGHWQAGIGRLRTMGIECWIMAGWSAYFMLIGGDLYLDRFLVFLLPLTGILMMRLAGTGWLQRLSGGLVVALVLLPWWLGGGILWSADKGDPQLEMGRLLAMQGGGSLATDSAGKLPFISGLPTLDMLGLNDRHIANVPARGQFVGHLKYDADYVFLASPRWIVVPTELFDEGLDGRWGMARERYVREGYRLAFVFWYGAERQPSDGVQVIDVRSLSLAETEGWIRKGYGRLVLERIAP